MQRLAILIAIASLAGCHVSIHGDGPTIHGSGVRVTDMREVADFGRLRLEIPADVIVETGPERSLEVELDDNLVDVIVTTIEDHTLTIRSESPFSTKAGITVRVTIPDLTAVSVLGNGTVTAHGLRSSDELKIRVTGNGEVVVDGTAGKADVRVTGAGEVNLTKLQCQTAEIRAVGSASISVCASEEIDVRITGSGSVRYCGPSGSAPRVKQRIVGSGSVKPL